MLRRALELPPRPRESFFLWGPRQTGKTTLLKACYPTAPWVDLLRSEEFIRYTHHPELLRKELESIPKAAPVVIDEIQKVPALLDEVHWMIENTGRHFALCGSSARKVRRGHANLLGGRAVRYELFGLVSHELRPGFDLTRMLNHGYLPRHYLDEAPERLLRAYVGDYLKEEIAAEGLVRNLPAFATFLETAALSDTEIVNFATIARECAVSAPAVKEYFQILVDTLLGRYLAAYARRPKRRVIQAPKFYFADVGVVNLLARRGRLVPGSELFGKAFENWVCHELCSHREYSGEHHDLSYWRLASGIEVDFIVGDARYAIEAKATSRVTSDRLRGLRELAIEHPRVERRFLVCLDAKPWRTEDGIEIIPVTDFVRGLWEGELLRPARRRR